METYLTIEGLAEYLKLSEQTIRRYVLNREIPYHKIKKVIRFRLSEIETWINRGGGKGSDYPVNDREGNLFGESEVAESGETLTVAGADRSVTGEDIKASEPTGGAA